MISFAFARESVARLPVVSAGIAARFNLFGYFVFDRLRDTFAEEV